MKTIVLSLLGIVAIGGSVLAASMTEPAPSFAIQLLDEERTLTDRELRGVYTLVTFWSTTCGACIREMDYLHAAYERYGDRIEMISISRDRSADAVQRFRETRHPMPWLHAVVGPDSQVFDDFGVRGTPHVVLIGPDGQIVARTRHLLGERLLRTLEQHVAGCG
jgi:thiol-disulfide isomerase/thioredoxin